MSDLIGYAVAYRSNGVVNFSGTQARTLEEAELFLKARDTEYPLTAHFLIEIYPDSREMREEVTHG